ncbi:MAG: LptE family protein [Candidatus Aminicenantes bacterium]|nr:LptE family protein [Candidatus Aminicenantes bacterium]
MTNKKKLFTAALVLLTASAWLLSCFTGCGYRLSGYGTEIPDYIKTILIPDFDNKTTRFQAEQFVTFAVREEFIRRSRLKLTADRAKADSRLEGEILKFEVRPISSTRESTANLYKVIILISVKFIDLKTDKAIYSDANLTYIDTYEIDTGDFFSQETKTLQDIAEKFAAGVVTTILESF